MKGMIGSFDGLQAEAPYPGLERRTFDSTGATVNHYRFQPGARFPPHRHPQEQITLIQEGEVEMTIEGDVTMLAAGQWSVVGPDVEHGIQAGPNGASILAIVVPRRAAVGAYTVVE